ncbi:DUF6461 domain-containing protein [Planobispora siamensis]|uniref:Immunity protein 51 n=1 Tax=Planobispora siamensis TaxID=936338 RepID=A0A8J3WLQ3_9ACTN|nr:DUF6461 domain-containing protein [Planobispora siamensis]GIH93860.1 hypothetical protein Psi01_44900 [Planobispora siamensis]
MGSPARYALPYPPAALGLTRPALAGPLSAGTFAAAVLATSENESFAYCVDGQAVTTFGLYSYSLREGSDPDRLRADVEDLGMNVDGDQLEFPDDPVRRALALAERAAGVHFSAAHYARPALAGPTEHLDPCR